MQVGTLVRHNVYYLNCKTTVAMRHADSVELLRECRICPPKLRSAVRAAIRKSR
jgi:hypothetical protein